MKTFLVAGLVLMMASAAQAQTDYIELFRSDLKTEKVAIFTESLHLTEEESQIFWPIYREFDVELNAIQDSYVALIKKYAENFGNMTDEFAKELADESFKISEKRLALKKKYFKRMSKELDATTAATFVQIENQVEMLIQLQVAASLPLIKQ